MSKINALDAEILKNLLSNGRISYDDLAKECKSTKNKVWKRCKALEKKGVIKGATIQVNFAKFGFDALATLLIKVDPPQIVEVMEYIHDITELRAYRLYNSAFNVRVVVTLRNLNELDQIKQIIREKLPTISLKTYLWMGVRNIPENLNLTGAQRKSAAYAEKKRIINQQSTPEIDELDNKIVQKLNRNGRASFSEIAEQLDVSTHTVIKRFEKLEKMGAINVCVQINPHKIGYVAILDVNVAFTTLRGLSTNIVDTLAKIPDVITITKTIGDFDLQVTAMVRDLKEALHIQDEVARIEGVTQIEASLRKVSDKWPSAKQHITTI